MQNGCFSPHVNGVKNYSIFTTVSIEALAQPTIFFTSFLVCYILVVLSLNYYPPLQE